MDITSTSNACSLAPPILTAPNQEVIESQHCCAIHQVFSAELIPSVEQLILSQGALPQSQATRQLSNQLNIYSDNKGIERQSDGGRDTYIVLRCLSNDYYGCPTFNHQGSMNSKSHQRMHTGERTTYCKTFSLTYNLKAHEHTHTVESPFICTTCGKAFSKYFNLKVHQRVHTGEKPFVCTTCSKTFSRTSNLKMHQHTHTGDKPFQCNTCQKTFSDSSNLKKHQRVHTGEKPYQCNTCGKAFTRQYTLQNHQRIHARKWILSQQ